MEKWKKEHRKEYLEQKEYRYYIFCEGEQTEPQYFNGFKQFIRYAKRIMAVNEGKSPAEIAPGTKVYELVVELVKYLPEDEKELFL